MTAPTGNDGGRSARRGTSRPARSLAAVARGRWGEEQAQRWYLRRGYTVVACNWRNEHGEIDLVLRSGRLVVFCEVKARASERYGPAASAVGRVKQLRLRRLAASWLAATGTRHVDVRFDVATVTGTIVDVIEDAF